MTKLPNPIGRSTNEWCGATADSKPPPHVRARIFDRANGICHISGRKIMPGEVWDLEHVIRLADGGENRESNLRPALRDKHREKTAAENIAAVPIRARHASHIGVKSSPSRPIQSAPFRKSARMIARLERGEKTVVPRRGMFEED